MCWAVSLSPPSLLHRMGFALAGTPVTSFGVRACPVPLERRSMVEILLGLFVAPCSNLAQSACLCANNFGNAVMTPNTASDPTA